MKLLIYLSIGLTIANTILQASESRLLDGSFLTTLRAEAVAHHPTAIAASLRASAASSDVRAVRLWDDPTMGLALMAAESEKRHSDGDIRIGWEQALPKRGLFAAKEAKASAAQRAEFDNWQNSRIEIGAAAARDAIELALTDESIAIQSELIAWLVTMVGDAKQSALDPDGNSINALRLEAELAREKQVLDAAQRTRKSVAQRLNLDLGRLLESPWPALRLSTSPPPVPIARAEIARITRANLKVRSAAEMVSVANAESRIADLERQPQLSVAVDAEIYSGGDFRSATLGLKMSLPYFNRNASAATVEASRLREKSAAMEMEATRKTVASAVLAAVAEVANANAQARAYTGEIYQRELQASQAEEARWISSKGSLSDLLVSRKNLLATQLESRRFIAMQWAALEELNKLVPERP
ncbi:MAG: TolC family protein [Akkermansiaceae bacterium]|nr:TolC family protein [Akkermansiaceae bacterium]